MARTPDKTFRPSVAARPPAAERVTQTLREVLVQQQLEPGTQINQEEWGARLGVSRGALREGLKVLATEGLLHHDPHRGYFVAEFDPDGMAQLYWLRMLVERAVIESIREPTEDETQKFEDAHKRSVDAFAVGDISTCIAADREFFLGIYDLSDLDYLRGEARRLWDLSSAYRAFKVAAAAALEGFEPQFRARRAQQLRALLDGDRFLLADLIVSERRQMAEGANSQHRETRLLFKH